LGLVVLRKNSNSPINRSFFAFTVLLSVYISVSYLSVLLESALLFKSTFAISILLKITAIVWIISLCKGITKKTAISLYSIALVLMTGILFEGFMVKNILFNGSGFDYEMGTGSPLSLMFSIAIVLYGTYLLVKTAIKEKGLIRKKLFIITIGIVSYAILSFITSVLLPSIGMSSLTFLDIPESLIFISLLSYAMIKFKLRD